MADRLFKKWIQPGTGAGSAITLDPDGRREDDRRPVRPFGDEPVGTSPGAATGAESLHRPSASRPCRGRDATSLRPPGTGPAPSGSLRRCQGDGTSLDPGLERIHRGRRRSVPIPPSRSLAPRAGSRPIWEATRFRPRPPRPGPTASLASTGRRPPRARARAGRPRMWPGVRPPSRRSRRTRRSPP